MEVAGGRRWGRMRGAWTLIALMAALSCGSGTPAPASPPPAAVTGPETPEDAPAGDRRRVPDVRFDYFDGSEGSLADFAGTPTVINFWASWCPPCITEMPAFEAVHRELGPNVAFLGVNVGDEPGAARELAERTGVTYPLAEDPDSAIFRAFGGLGMPTTVLVDGHGTIMHMVASRLKAQDLRGLIAEHLGR
ncbi:MAG: TlpA disulfide reductase family protein [bacterium]|nr:TlpA disulfide reductase family protein [bacterium]